MSPVEIKKCPCRTFDSMGQGPYLGWLRAKVYGAEAVNCCLLYVLYVIFFIMYIDIALRNKPSQNSIEIVLPYRKTCWGMREPCAEYQV